MDSELEATLVKLTGYEGNDDEDDEEAEEVDEEEMQELGRDLQRAFAEEDWDEALDVLDEMLEMDEDNFQLKRALFITLCRQAEEPDEIAEVAEDLIEGNEDDAELLNLVAWELVTCTNVACRNPVLAMEVAEQAYEASEGEAGHVIDTLARAYYLAGELDEAIRLQKVAVEKGEGTPYEDGLEEALEYYEQCRKARKHMKKH
jgi:tetratricopeptide (TPR) repeat protein